MEDEATTENNQMSSINVVRPSPEDAPLTERIKFNIEKNNVIIDPKAGNSSSDKVSRRNNILSYTYDDILVDTTQENVFLHCGYKVLNRSLEGYNGTIMAYGQTGSGKTYTMTGNSNYSERGIIPRMISQLFKSIEELKDVVTTIRLSYIEIYNDNIYDLLQSNESSLPEINLLEDKHHNIIMKGVKYITIKSESDALNALFEGESNRAIASHMLNNSSTRSHCIFTLYLQMEPPSGNAGESKYSKINLVDLAGSERVDKTLSEGDVFEEAKYINQSLSYLEQVVIALTNKSREHIPYRQSKLTTYLRDSLGGNSETLLIACLWPEDRHFDDSVSTLRFAARMKKIKNKIKLNKSESGNSEYIKKLKNEISLLKDELGCYDIIHNNPIQTYEPYSDTEKQSLKQQLLSYLQNDINIDITSLRQVTTLLELFKDIYTERSINPISSSTVSSTESSPIKLKQQQQQQQQRVTQSAPVESTTMNESNPIKLMSKEEALAYYRDNEGKSQYTFWNDSKSSVKSVKLQLKELKNNINTYKLNIDRLTSISNNTSTNNEDNNILIELKEQKKNYRTAYTEYEDLKSQLEYLNNVSERYKSEFINQFNRWYEDNTNSDTYINNNNNEVHFMNNNNTIFPPINNSNTTAVTTISSSSVMNNSSPRDTSLSSEERNYMTAYTKTQKGNNNRIHKQNKIAFGKAT